MVCLCYDNAPDLGWQVFRVPAGGLSTEHLRRLHRVAPQLADGVYVSEDVAFVVRRHEVHHVAWRGDVHPVWSGWLGYGASVAQYADATSLRDAVRCLMRRFHRPGRRTWRKELQR